MTATTGPASSRRQSWPALPLRTSRGSVLPVSAFKQALGIKEAEKEEPEEEEFDLSGKRVLLAEDNAINTEVAQLLLKSKGADVDVAENGLRALEKLAKSEEGYYDAILMDIRMADHGRPHSIQKHPEPE